MGLFEDAKQMLLRAIEECSDIGDLYYYIARVAKLEGKVDEYRENLNNALQNRNTLTIDVHRVMDELSEA